MKTLYSFIAALLLALGFAGQASAQTAADFAFSDPNSPISSGNFWFTFNGTRYGTPVAANTGPVPQPNQDIGPNETVNLATLVPAFAQTSFDDTATNNDYWYGFYRQNYVTVVGYLDSNATANYFVKDIVGEKTALAALPTSGTYNYSGTNLWHHTTSNGTFDYTLDLATKQGSGSISGVGFSWMGLPVSASGDLDPVTFAYDSSDNTVGFKGGAVSNLTSGNAILDALYVSGIDATYDIALFGPGAEEIAGRVILDDQLGSIGFAGVRTTP